MIKLFDDLWLDADEYCFILKEDSGKVRKDRKSPKRDGRALWAGVNAAQSLARACQCHSDNKVGCLYP